MDAFYILVELFKACWWLIPVVLAGALLKSPAAKGYFGELAVRFSAASMLDKDVYRAIHNVTLPTADGTTQIDHVFVSQFGIFVVETKNMKGWIFGSERQPQWTQQIFKYKSKFQNPLHQNYKHAKTLESLLHTPAGTVHSIVAFVSDCTFKTDMPPNVTRGSSYAQYIRSFSTPIFTASQIDDFVNIIESGRLQPTLSTHREHVQRLQQRLDQARTCPECGSHMVLRTAKSGSNAGNKFWGCSAFPKCRAIQSL